MVKLFLLPQKYGIGVNLSEQQFQNIKMLSTAIYNGGVRSFASQGVEVKSKDF